MAKDMTLDQAKTEQLTRGESIWVLEWLTFKMKKPTPKHGFYALLRRSPIDVAKEYGVDVMDLISVTRRKVATQ